MPNTHFQFVGSPLTNWTGDNADNAGSGPGRRIDIPSPPGGTPTSSRTNYPWTLKSMQLEFQTQAVRDIHVSSFMQYKLIIVQGLGALASTGSASAHTGSRRLYLVGDVIKIPSYTIHFIGRSNTVKSGETTTTESNNNTVRNVDHDVSVAAAGYGFCLGFLTPEDRPYPAVLTPLGH